MTRLLLAIILVATLSSMTADAQLMQTFVGPGAAGSGTAPVNACTGVNGVFDFSQANGCNSMVVGFFRPWDTLVP